MYLENIISIDPSELTKIEKKEPTKAFKKLLFNLTKGIIADKKEVETFTAISILQQLNTVFRSLKITNIIKISHDNIDFYHDKEGKKDDLKFALDKYEIETNEAMSILFEKIELILEHEDDHFKYLIEIFINRTHNIGDFPIEIKVVGLFKKIDSPIGTDQIKKVTEGQVVFDAFKHKKRQQFDFFCDNILFEIKKQIKIDNVISEFKTKIVLPKKKTNHKKNRYGSSIINTGYYGFDHYIVDLFLWSEILHFHPLTIEDIYFENEQGEELGYSESIQSDSVIFDSESSIYVDDTITSSYSVFSDTDSDSSWFTIDSDSSWSSCSSCSSGCSSCGGD